MESAEKILASAQILAEEASSLLNEAKQLSDKGSRSRSN
jgi:hypothetical protein